MGITHSKLPQSPEVITSLKAGGFQVFIQATLDRGQATHASSDHCDFLDHGMFSVKVKESFVWYSQKRTLDIGLNLRSVRNTPICSVGESRIIVWLNITGSGIGLFWLKKWTYLYLVVWPWTCCHTSVLLAFLIKRMQVMVKITRVFVKVKWLAFVGRVQKYTCYSQVLS